MDKLSALLASLPQNAEQILKKQNKNVLNKIKNF